MRIKNVFRSLLATMPVFLLLQQTAIRASAKEIANDRQTIRISASNFEFKPSVITVKKGVPVTLEFVSEDHHHGIKLPEFHLRADIRPGTVEKVQFVPDKTGTFTFFCDVFCGDGHEEMSGRLRVIEP